MSVATDMARETKGAVLPAIRCDQTLRERLERVVGHSIVPQLSVHLRIAVEQYVASQENTLGIRHSNSN